MDRIGGHFVTGHVDGTSKIASKATLDTFTQLRVADIDRKLARYLIKKGSVAINGVSLTSMQ